MHSSLFLEIKKLPEDLVKTHVSTARTSETPDRQWLKHRMEPGTLELPGGNTTHTNEWLQLLYTTVIFYTYLNLLAFTEDSLCRNSFPLNRYTVQYVLLAIMII